MAYLTGNHFALTDKGLVRETNEDSVVTTINAYANVLLAVADGMGGASKGDYASSTLLKYISKRFLENEKELTKEKEISKWLTKVIGEANRKIFEKAQNDKEYFGMGSTLSLCYIVKDLLVTAQVGDSRIYFADENGLRQISTDQSYVQYLSHNYKLKESEMSTHKERHKITNAIGTKKVLNIDIQTYEYKGEKILLCSDGLYNNVSKSVMESILLGNDSIDKKCQQLITFGNANGGTDNMAVVIWESNK